MVVIISDAYLQDEPDERNVSVSIVMSTGHLAYANAA